MQNQPNCPTVTKILAGKPIVFQQDDAFVNVTLMCKAFKKRLSDFLALDRVRIVLSALAAETGQLPSGLIVKKKGSNGGTWLHPDLALECVRWLSPVFVIWFNRIIRGILARQPPIHGLPIKTLEAIAPTNPYGSLARNGKYRYGWRRVSYVAAFIRTSDATALHNDLEQSRQLTFSLE